MKTSKVEYYSDKSVVRQYKQKRYGGKSGSYINRRELSTVKSFLPEEGRILDVACGLGRLGDILSKRHKVVGVDSSKEMLYRCAYKNKILSNATSLPFKDEFDIVVILRLLFHYRNIRTILSDAKRVTKKGGFIIFETYRWSPKMLFDINSFGGRVYIHSDRKIKRLLNKMNLKVVDKVSISIFSPYLQRMLPLSIVKLLRYLERFLPKNILVDVYWKVQKV